MVHERHHGISSAYCCIETTRQILGIDTTYNLEAIYVTVICFEYPALRRKVSMEKPVLFGPNLLHGSCKHDIYGHFFSNFSTTYSVEEIAELTIRSDNEQALIKEIKKVFSLS